MPVVQPVLETVTNTLYIYDHSGENQCQSIIIIRERVKNTFARTQHARVLAHQVTASNRSSTPHHTPSSKQKTFSFLNPEQFCCERISHFSPWQLTTVVETDSLTTKLEFPIMRCLSARDVVITQFSVFSFVSCHSIYYYYYLFHLLSTLITSHKVSLNMDETAYKTTGKLLQTSTPVTE